MKDTETSDNVIPFPPQEPAPSLDCELSCEGRAPASDTPGITAWAPMGRTYDLEDSQDLKAYMAAEMHIALKIQGLFGVEEANEWVKFHRGLYQDDEQEGSDD